MYLLGKFGRHRFYGNGYISYINSYVITSEKSELNASIHHIERILKSGILIYNSEVPGTADRKRRRRRRRRTQANAKRCAFHADTIKKGKEQSCV